MSDAPRNEAADLFAEMSATAFASWRHSPVTKAFLQFMRDQAQAYREGAADLWEFGRLNQPGGTETSDVLRGRFLAMKETADIDLAAIQEFYGLEVGSSEGREEGK